MRSITVVAGLVVSLVAGVVPAFAEQQPAGSIRVEAAPIVGYGLDVPNQVGDRGSLSTGALVHLYLGLFDSERVELILNPDFEYYLTDIDDVTALQADLNLLLGIAPLWHIMPYAGLGVALTSVSGDDAFSGVTDGTNIGLNVLGGLRLGRGPIHPFFQVRYTAFDHNLYFEDEVTAEIGDGFGVQGGILFLLNP